MNYSEFEKNAAKKINQYASGVDGEALWSAIRSEVPAARNNRKGFFWLFFAGFLLVAGTIYIFNLNSSNANPQTTELAIAAAISDEKLPTTIEKTETELSTENQSNALSEQIKSETKVAEAEVLPTIQNNKKYKAISTKESKELPLVISDEPIVSTTESSESKNPNVENSQQPVNSEPLTFSEQETAETISPDSGAEAVESTFSEGLALTGTDTLSLDENQAEKIDLATETPKPLLSPPSKGLGLNFGFGIYGGISRSTAEFSLKEGTDPVYLQNRLNSEKQLETLHLGLEVIAQTDKNLYFRTGVQYSRIGRRFAVDVEEIAFDTIPDGIQAIYVNTTTNDTIIIYGEVVKEITTTYDKTTYNYFHLLDIPLLAGYSFNNENWSIGVEAGAVLNVSNQSKGEIYDLNGAFYDLKTDTNDWYKTNIGVGLMAGLSAAYKLDYNFQFYISPTFRTGSVFSTDKNPLEQKHASLGVNAGVRYFLD